MKSRCPGDDNPLVVIAEDHEDTLHMLKFAFESNGFLVDLARTSLELLEVVDYRCSEDGQCPDAIVTDIQFLNDTLSGIGAARTVRKEYPNIPVVFISAYVNSLIREEAMKVGDAIIAKPLNPSVLVERVCYLIQLSVHRYSGPERRIRSINRSGQSRRATDHRLEVRPAIRDAISQRAQSVERKAAG